jgi:putative acetyltransferase
MFVPHRSLFATQSGEPAPFLTGVRANKAPYSFSEQAGRPAVLLHVGLLGLSAGAPFAAAFHRRAGEFEARGADVLCLVDATTSHSSVYAAAPLATPHVVFCPPEVLRPWLFDPREPAVVVVDGAMRVIASIVSADPDDTVEAAVAALAICAVAPPRDETSLASGDASRNSPPERSSPLQGVSKRWFTPPAGVQFRARRPEHAAGLFALFNERQFTHRASTRNPLVNEAEVNRWLDGIIASRKFEVVAISDAKLVAFAGLYVHGDLLDHCASLMLGVCEEAQGRGIGSTLMAILLATAKLRANLRKVQLTVFTDNTLAIRLYRSFGFQFEGLHRCFSRRGDGYVDAYSMAVIFDC